MRIRPSKRLFAVIGVLVAIAGAGIAINARTGTIPNITTTEVTRGDFVDYIQIRGDIRPAKSIQLAAPLEAGGELQIVKLVKNGAAVKKGDIVVEFDATTLNQRLMERRSELKTAEGEIEQSLAQTKITAEQRATEIMKAKYDVERAKLDLGKRDLVSRIEYENAKLALSDAEQRLKEIEARSVSTQAGIEAELTGRRRKRDKALADVERTLRSIAALKLWLRQTARSTCCRTRVPAVRLAAAASSSAKGIGRGQAPAFSNCPICRRFTWRRASTSPIAAA